MLFAMKKILSIDGGGIKGVFPASFLSAIEDTIDANVGDYFDLIVGTSTGGIIALGLGLGMSASEILSFYEDHGPEIFRGNRLARWLKHWGMSKYDSSSLRAALEGVFGDNRLGNCKIRVVIPSMNLETGKVHIYKTAHHPKFEFDYKCSAVDVALATSAAPTYFPTHQSNSSIPLIDGGIWANNPVGAAVVEGIGILGWESSQIRVLSIGCTSEPLSVNWGRSWALGKAYWGTKLTDVFLASQSSASLGTANVLTSEDHSSVFRFDPIVARSKFALDAVKDIALLKGLGTSEAREAFPSIRFFFNEKADIFTPCKVLEKSI